jgi:hypothetical protein
MGGTFLKHVVAAEKQSSLPLALTFLMLYGLIMITILCKSQFIYCTTFWWIMPGQLLPLLRHFVSSISSFPIHCFTIISPIFLICGWIVLSGLLTTKW